MSPGESHSDSVPFHHPMAQNFTITEDLITRLREDAILRRIESSIEWFREHRSLFILLDPNQKNAPAFVGYLSQWVDIGYGDFGIIRELLARFPKPVRSTLPLRDYVHLKLAEGMAASAEEEVEEAMKCFDFILSMGEEAVADDQLALAHFWKGRCQRRLGEYDSALSHTIRGKELALGLGYPRTAAVMQVLESWLYFQKENHPRAVAILKESEAILRETDDSVSLGNIHSGFGRIAMREGRYDQALEHFEAAIESYCKRDPRHRNLARSLANVASVKRLIVLRLARKLDASAAARRKSPAGETAAAIQNLPSRQRLEQLRQEALASLSSAEEIYSCLHHSRGLGTVRIDRGLLFLDTGDIERAEVEADEAYKLGAEKKDRILMARARILQSTIESAKYDEGIDERGLPEWHAQRAHDYAKDAMTLAGHTENRRLLARCYIRRGFTLCTDFLNNVEAARECCDHAGEYVAVGDHDQLWEEHQLLKKRILLGGGIDPTLRKWSQGLVDDKTFQQLTERFADLIIPKVWEREGRRISRVAAKLSVSPKRVRSILDRLGLKRGLRDG
jgi:tetratricopeptide (TPR) repeat protein